MTVKEAVRFLEYRFMVMLNREFSGKAIIMGKLCQLLCSLGKLLIFCPSDIKVQITVNRVI
jgi:hypothetical protein